MAIVSLCGEGPGHGPCLRGISAPKQSEHRPLRHHERCRPRLSVVDFATPNAINILHTTTTVTANPPPIDAPKGTQPAPPNHPPPCPPTPTASPPSAPRSPSSPPRSPPSTPASKTSRASPRCSNPCGYVPLPPSSQTKLTNPPPQHYELIPHPTLSAAESSLRDEIGPFVALLLDRADKHLARQARRIETLKARADLNAGRLSHTPAPTSNPAPVRKSGKRLDGEAALRAKVVRGRKEALQYGVERLELEVLQKERELKVRVEAGRGR